MKSIFSAFKWGKLSLDTKDNFGRDEEAFSVWKVLIVSKNIGALKCDEEVSKGYFFEDKKVEFITVDSIKKAKDLFNEEINLAVVIIDISTLTEQRSLKLIDYIRDEINNRLVQIVLTDNDLKGRKVENIVKDYEINDYKVKGDLLSNCFQISLIIYLRSYKRLKELRKSLIAKKRIEDELKVANKIQNSILPGNEFPLPKGEEFEIFASMEAARVVGGDFYDAFFVFDNRLCFFIGDVSGKGIPAALFMAITKTLIKNEVLKGLAIEDVFYNVNNTLCKGNEEQFFATAALGVLDLKSGEVEFINAGHNMPVIYTPKEGCMLLRPNKNIVLGALDGFRYKVDKFKLSSGDILTLYTDGVVEARNNEKVRYSRRRLEEIICKVSNKQVDNIEKKIKEDIHNFISQEPQFDDITMVILKYKGRGKYYADDFIL
ncbi:PP2C family protein-serine/threonine phosphatase [Halonatronum saccharophilum]|uniref:PP2C family protein-serine/threonine phosphatase n=1 Tax=Halonatronum saccharophilum TaxID=150060 RepID=UPI0012EB3AB3|nr:PP2C family protein-serine/threonine phosphatase [Halonatronum saccharophilum]